MGNSWRDAEDGMSFGERHGCAFRGLLVSLGAVVMLLAACGGGSDVESADGDSETIVEDAQEQGFEELVVDEPFEGTAVVTSVLSPHAFNLLDTLVVSKQVLDVKADERVRVRGTVRRTTIEELEGQLGVDFTEAVHEAHDGELLVVAEEVTPVDFPDPID